MPLVPKNRPFSSANAANAAAFARDIEDAPKGDPRGGQYRAPSPADEGNPAVSLAARMAQLAAQAGPKPPPHLIVRARAGTGKCLGLGTPVLTFDGDIKPVEEVEAGDWLMGPDSRPRLVLSTSVGRGPLYRITPAKGDSWVCNDAHVMTVVGTNHVMGQVKDVPLSEYLEDIERGRPHCNSWKLFRTGVEFWQEEQPAPLPVPPYLVGLWMGDGSVGTAILTNRREKIQEYCVEQAERFGLKCVVSPDKREDKNTARIRFVHHSRTDTGVHSARNSKGCNPLADFFSQKCSIGRVKVIPREYLVSSRSERLELLAGIIDTDGEDTQGTYTVVGVTGQPYRDSLLFLCRSLGLAAYCNSSNVHVCASGKVSTYYGISISGKLHEVPTRIKKFTERIQSKRTDVTGFEAECIGEGDYYGFTLDGDGRFLLGDFTVTHNTTTIVKGLFKVKGLPVDLTPSPQQAAVWDAMALSAGAKTVGMVAFNKAIADDFSKRVPAGVDAMTMHSLGNKAVRRAFGAVRVDQYRVSDIACDILGVDPREFRKRDAATIPVVTRLVGLCKMNLVVQGDVAGARGYAAGVAAITGEELGALAAHYDIDLDGANWDKVCELVPRVLTRCLDVRHDNAMDFDDMVWLPVALDLPVFKYDLLCVDESQDLNRCQQSLARKAGRRLVMIDDDRQAIYGFAGADSKSLDRMVEELAGDGGCAVLPLTETRRCGQAIVKEAKALVPDFEAHPSNPEGKVSRAAYPTHKDTDGNTVERPFEKTYLARIKPGDMAVCRVNAPLVSQCFRLLKRGVKANIQGRDVGQGLISTVTKVKAQTVPDLIGGIDDWLDKELKKENAKRNPSEARPIALQDRADCLHCFCDGAASVTEVISRIEAMFTDDRTGTDRVKFSSIHKSKGLEAGTVFLLEPSGATVPHPMAKGKWQVEQEWNCRYIAITRAKDELVYVG